MAVFLQIRLRSRANNPARQMPCLILLLAGCLPWESSFTASISLDPDAQIALPGSQISVAVVGDFSDEVTLGGGIDVAYDSNMLQLVSFTHSGLGSTQYQRNPDEAVGQLSGIAFGDFSGFDGEDVIGTLVFTISPVTEESTTVIEVNASAGVAGPFASGIAPFSLQVVDFQQGSVIILNEGIFEDGFESE